MKSFAFLALCIGSSLAAPQSYFNTHSSPYTYRSNINYQQPRTYYTPTAAAPTVVAPSAFAAPAVVPTRAAPAPTSAPYNNPYVIKTQGPSFRTAAAVPTLLSTRARNVDDVNAPNQVSAFPKPESVYNGNGRAASNYASNTRNGVIPSIASLQPSSDRNTRINSDFYAQKAFKFPIAITSAIRAGRDNSSPNARAALEYMKAAGANDICGRATKVYLEVIVNGGSVDEANSAATKIYIDDYNNGLRVERGSACEASDIAWRKAEAEGKDPVVASALAFMENWPGTKEGNPCAVSGRDYVIAILDGASHTQANLYAAKSFAAAIRKLAAEGKELRDPVCAASTKAYYEALPNKPSPPNAAAMLAFLDKAFSGFSFEYDPVCWRSTEAFFDSYAAGKDELSSNLAAAEVFLDEFSRGGQAIPADSPCAAATIAYYKNIPSPPSPANKAAMEAFIAKMVKGGRREPDPACAEATKAYWRAYRSGATETDSNLAAAESFFKAFGKGLSIAADSPCAAATKAYFRNLPVKPSGPNAEAMIDFMDAMIAQGNKRVYDPACADASLAYFNAYKSGKDELSSNFAAALAFIKQYKKGAKVPTNSPCLIATRKYAAQIKNKPSLPNAEAMLAFMDEAINADLRKPDPVCLTSAEAYFEAYLDGKSEAAANEIAGVAFLDAVAASPDFDPSSPCGASARTYMANLDL